MYISYTQYFPTTLPIVVFKKYSYIYLYHFFPRTPRDITSTDSIMTTIPDNLVDQRVQRSPVCCMFVYSTVEVNHKS